MTRSDTQTIAKFFSLSKWRILLLEKARAFYEDATKNQIQTHSKSLSSNNTYLFDLAITRSDTQTIAQFFSLSKWRILLLASESQDKIQHAKIKSKIVINFRRRKNSMPRKIVLALSFTLNIFEP